MCVHMRVNEIRYKSLPLFHPRAGGWRQLCVRGTCVCKPTDLPQCLTQPSHSTCTGSCLPLPDHSPDSVSPLQPLTTHTLCAPAKISLIPLCLWAFAQAIPFYWDNIPHQADSQVSFRY